MNAEAKKKLAEFNALQRDWYTTCPKCGAKLVGTICDLEKHDCQAEQPDRTPK